MRAGGATERRLTESQRQTRELLLVTAIQLMFGLFLALCLCLLASALMPDVMRPWDTVLTGEDFGIPSYISDRDGDWDEVDDQTDILESAKAYVATNPTYRSDYYQGGWPDDGTGVCTDVIAYALRDSGYDLQAMVDADIRMQEEHRNPTDSLAYEVQKRDSNIDYRRVRNLRVFFDHYAKSLTCDTSDISEWQGGDIVCYEDHIGIVSDRRNSDGVPYIIHHGSPWQRAYEENRLDDWGGPVSHWRWAGDGIDRILSVMGE